MPRVEGQGKIGKKEAQEAGRFAQDLDATVLELLFKIDNGGQVKFYCSSAGDLMRNGNEKGRRGWRVGASGKWKNAVGIRGRTE